MFGIGNSEMRGPCYVPGLQSSHSLPVYAAGMSRGVVWGHKLQSSYYTYCLVAIMELVTSCPGTQLRSCRYFCSC